MKLFREIKPVATDERGDIIELLDEGKGGEAITAVTLITCRPGAIRANHYHKENSHYCYMLSGSMEYTEQPVDGTEADRETVVVKAGDMVYTPPMVIHAMRFLEESSFLTLSPRSRKDGAYEDDLVRHKLI